MRGASLVVVMLVACGPADADGDGFTADVDCNDANARVAPGMVEICDGIDQNCDGVIDNNPVDGGLFYRDNDQDTYGDDAASQLACTVPAGFAARGGDCDDANPDKNPSGVDTADEDRNCDGLIDNEKKKTNKTFDGPTTIDSVDASCTNGVVTFRVETTGLTDGGLVFFQETGNLEPHYSEEHDLESVKADPNGFFDTLEQSITDGAEFGSQVRNQDTVFTCEISFDTDVMSVAFAVVDDLGAILDCVAIGDDPKGMIDEAYYRVNDPSFDLTSCSIQE